MSGSTWMKLWSSVTSANAWIFSCDISIQDDGPNSAPTSMLVMRMSLWERVRVGVDGRLRRRAEPERPRHGNSPRSAEVRVAVVVVERLQARHDRADDVEAELGDVLGRHVHPERVQPGRRDS